MGDAGFSVVVPRWIGNHGYLYCIEKCLECAKGASGQRNLYAD